MSTHEVHITRRQLHEQVWSTPMRHLAKQYGLSDVGLAKICKKFDIPRPGLGYWAKVQHGMAVRSDELPNPEVNPEIVICAHQPPTTSNSGLGGFTNIFDRALESEAYLPRIVVTGTRNINPWGTPSLEVLRTAKTDEWGRCVPEDDHALGICVSPKCLLRAHRIKNALLTGHRSPAVFPTALTLLAMARCCCLVLPNRGCCRSPRHREAKVSQPESVMSGTTEFKYNAPTAWRGFTTIEAATFLREAVPAETQWMVWVPEQGFMKRLLMAGGPDHGATGAWRWQRIPCSYPALFYYQESEPKDEQRSWIGLVEVTAPDQRRFFVFSYLNACGQVGVHYFVSTLDTRLLAEFTEAVRCHRAAAEKIVITVPRGENLQIDANSSEYLCLPDAMRADIEHQALSFFTNEKAFQDLGIAHRRGFLFVGPPGCGKTMTIRHLIRKIHQQTTVSCLSLKNHPYPARCRRLVDRRVKSSA